MRTECIGCEYFYYDSGDEGQCNHFLKELCFKTDKMFYVLPIQESDCSITSKEDAKEYLSPEKYSITIKEN